MRRDPSEPRDRQHPFGRDLNLLIFPAEYGGFVHTQARAECLKRDALDGPICAERMNFCHALTVVQKTTIVKTELRFCPVCVKIPIDGHCALCNNPSMEETESTEGKMSYLKAAAIGAATGLAAFAITVTIMVAPVRAEGPDAVTRQIGLEMLRVRMIEQRAEQARSINWTPPGYHLAPFTVRVG